jgi:hypothetical protein
MQKMFSNSGMFQIMILYAEGVEIKLPVYATRISTA